MSAATHPPPSQWLFPLLALQETPSVTTSNYSAQKELYDRGRGVEFLFRLGSSLGLPASAMFTAATWFHRFYMRYSLEDYHRQDVAAACIFLATKTEECGRKLRDVARVCHAKVTGLDPKHILPDGPEVKQVWNAILLTEEVLLEALCFDFVVGSPHAELVNLFDHHEDSFRTQEHAWSIAHDAYRTPLCILYPPRVIAAACYILAQCAVDGPHSPSMDARISSAPPSASLPTPPTHKSVSPDATRSSIEWFAFRTPELAQVSEALCILLQFYNAQDIDAHPYLSPLLPMHPPTAYPQPAQIYAPFTDMHNVVDHSVSTHPGLARTPSSSGGGSTPAKANGWIPVKADAQVEKTRIGLS